jgi:hypothetical protein
MAHSIALNAKEHAKWREKKRKRCPFLKARRKHGANPWRGADTTEEKT